MVESCIRAVALQTARRTTETGATRRPDLTSEGGVAAVDEVVAAGDEAGGVAGEEGDEVRDLVSLTETADRVLAHEEVLCLSLIHI